MKHLVTNGVALNGSKSSRLSRALIIGVHDYHGYSAVKLLPVLPPLQITFQDKRNSMKQSTKRIGLIILIVVLTIIECLLCLGIALDGKYQVEFSEDLAAIETFYRDVTILEVFMFINLGVAIVALCLLWRKNNDKDKSPDNKPNQ
jgi:hypothetical protein